MEPRLEADTKTIYSIGHSNLPIEEFIELLRQHQIEAVVDTRSYPSSKHAPHFNQPALSSAVKSAHMSYVFMGKELGGRPDDRRLYDADGRVLYGLVAETQLFRSGITRVERGCEKYRIALLCSEEDPLFCHRNLLIGRVLQSRGFEVLHIRRGGRLERGLELARRGSSQFRIFSDPEVEWKSTQSVLHKRALQPSSAF